MKPSAASHRALIIIIQPRQSSRQHGGVADRGHIIFTQLRRSSTSNCRSEGGRWHKNNRALFNESLRHWSLRNIQRLLLIYNTSITHEVVQAHHNCMRRSRSIVTAEGGTRGITGYLSVEDTIRYERQSITGPCPKSVIIIIL